MPRLSSLLVLFLALLSACTAPGDPADPALARDACRLDPDQPLPGGSLGSGLLAEPLDRGCVDQLGWDLGIDWAAYGHEARAFEQAGDPAEALVTGAWLILAADHGTVAQLADDPLAPAWARDALLAEAERVGLAGQDLAGDLLYAWVTARVRQVLPGPVEDGSSAHYLSARATIETAQDPPGLTVPPWQASVLLHETAHQLQPGHQACPDGQASGCDPDLQGPYGMQAWLTLRYAERVDTDSEAGLNACSDATAVIHTACGMVADSSSSELCTLEPAC